MPQLTISRIGDMSEAQEKALQDFKQLIQDEGLTEDPRFNDKYLLRFLRARDFKLEDTAHMFREFLNWRKEIKADNALVVSTSTNIQDIKVPLFGELKRRYKHGYHKTDKEGRPFYFDQPGLVKIDEMLDVVSEKDMQEYYMREYERLLHIRLPACSAAVGKEIDTTFSCLDMQGFSMSSLNKKTINFVKIAISMGQNYYPEIMFQMYIINCPLLFRGAYSMFKPFINEETRKKIHIRGSSFDDMFEKYVDKDNVPKIIGGNCECPGEDGCNLLEPGPWDEFPGDEVGQRQMEQLALEEAKESDPIEEVKAEAEQVTAEVQNLAEEVKELDKEAQEQEENLKQLSQQLHQAFPGANANMSEVSAKLQNLQLEDGEMPLRDEPDDSPKKQVDQDVDVGPPCNTKMSDEEEGDEIQIESGVVVNTGDVKESS